MDKIKNKKNKTIGCIKRGLWSVVFCFLNLFFTNAIFAQPTLTKQTYIKMAQAAEKNGKWSEAAVGFENAWQLQPKKYDLLSKAAMLYQKSRDYIKTAQCYKILVVQPQFASMRLDYARALHQSGQFDDAIPEYLLYLNNYEKKDREFVAEKIETDIAGCAKAIRETDSLSRQKNFDHWSSDIKLLYNAQNPATSVRSPILFSDDILYYLARTPKDTALMRSQWLSGDWSQGEQVPNMSAVTGGVIESGAFSGNSNVFYFSRLNTTSGNKKDKEKNTEPSTQLYLVERVNDAWSAPILLNENINSPASMNTQPFSIEKDGYEYLFFSSNRKSGAGGMDIWFSRRLLNHPLTAFEPAQNCGKIINTDGDEITPYFDTETGTLYFSSNSRPAFGGFDIFQSKGWGQQWLTPTNIGLPYNSCADDIYFRWNKSHTLNLVVSNRLFGLEKITTQDDDLFSFVVKNNTKDFFVNGRVFNISTGDLIKNERVTLYEKKDKDNLRLLSSIISNDGLFRFPIVPNKLYSLEIEKDSFNLKIIEFSSDILKEDIAQPIFLNKTYFANYESRLTNRDFDNHTTEILADKPLISNTLKPKNVVPKKHIDEPIHQPNSSVSSKVVYKVQVLAYEEMDWSVKKRLIRIEDIGNFDTEKININGKNFTRVLFRAVPSYSEALTVLHEVKNRSLNDAFIVRYENGKRTTK